MNQKSGMVQVQVRISPAFAFLTRGNGGRRSSCVSSRAARNVVFQDSPGTVFDFLGLFPLSLSVLE